MIKYRLVSYLIIFVLLNGGIKKINGMETGSTINSTILSEQQAKNALQFQKLYSSVFTTLQYFNPEKLTPVFELLEKLKKTQQKYNISLSALGLFAYDQKPNIFDFLTFNGGSIRTAVAIESIRQHNEKILKESKVNPTFQEFRIFLNNTSIVNERRKVVSKAKNLGIEFQAGKMKKKTGEISPLPPNCALQEFNLLVESLNNIKTNAIKDVREIADLIYRDKMVNTTIVATTKIKI